ncbi:putative G-protein coupled receptor [Pseudolycoriella hygida]|uniref:G-protein coupled receptor n=1 Tax=Pseudolycoriella hygida TaxID=35572 RepID=A0A9Q0N985_9DIPT|nr:putative G-protein coupled receptor [Pseudolycoriella hygida]
MVNKRVDNLLLNRGIFAIVFQKCARLIKVMGLLESPFIVRRLLSVFCAVLCLIAQTASEPCEPRVLEEVPPDPYYDASDVTVRSAKQLADYLGRRSSDALSTEVRQKANEIAVSALNEDEGLLAVAIAAPSIKLAVVQFRDHVENATNHSYLSTYWRELGEAWNHTDGSQFWGPPFRDCGPLQGRWLWPFSVTVQSSGYKTVASVFIPADEDQCNDFLEPIFGKKHSCDPETTFCFQSISNGSTATRGAYNCICNFGYYIPNQTLQGFEGHVVEAGNGNFSCLRCPGGCPSCDKSGVCNSEETYETGTMETLLKASIGAVLGACILCCMALAVIVFRQRKCKTIASGMWTVLEIILLGVVLSYGAVMMHFFPASTLRCLLEPWFREVGFIICYGAIILKLYRHLVDFRTRKAHRWVLRDVDLLKYLATMIFAVICYMSAFTASSYDLIISADLEGLQETNTNTCHPLTWEYVTQTSEILILVFGLHLGIASRNANTQFKERQFLLASLLIEFLVSTTYYVLRLVYMAELSPGEIFLALFLRSQLTNTVTVILIFLPKLWYQHKQVRSFAHDQSCRLPVDAFKGMDETSHQMGGYAGLCLGDPDIGELTISDMSSEDIRAELKRLYTQLEILKNKTLRLDNPHISKRRGGRKAHRRFSLQKKGSKDKASKNRNHRNNVQDVEVTEAEPSRTPEDSVCSVEGPTDTGGEVSNITINK